MEHNCSQMGEIGIIKQQIKTLFEDISEQKGLMKTMTDLTIEIHDLTVEMKSVKDHVGEVKKDVADLKNKPAKRYNDIIDTIIKLSAGGLVTHFLSRIFC